MKGRKIVTEFLIMPYANLIGKISNREIANMAGVSCSSITKFKKKYGIKTSVIDTSSIARKIPVFKKCEECGIEIAEEKFRGRFLCSKCMISDGDALSYDEQRDFDFSNMSAAKNLYRGCI